MRFIDDQEADSGSDRLVRELRSRDELPLRGGGLPREQLGEELLRIWGAQESSAVLMVTHSITEAILLGNIALRVGQKDKELKYDAAAMKWSKMLTNLLATAAAFGATDRNATSGVGAAS